MRKLRVEMEQKVDGQSRLRGSNASSLIATDVDENGNSVEMGNRGYTRSLDAGNSMSISMSLSRIEGDISL